MSKKYLVLIFTLLLFVVTAVGVYFFFKIEQKNQTLNEKNIGFKSCQDQYPFISSEIDCGSINERVEQVESLDRAIETFANQEEKSGSVEKVSVFFRDLNTRRWFGVNENVNFYPASLAKLPIAMMTYKSAEVNSRILDVALPITEEDVALNTGQHYQPEQSFEAGQSYPVRELIKKMLTHSDNAPVNPLLSASAMFKNAVLTDLGIYYPPEKGEADGHWNVTAKSYANLFRILYNASYLRHEYSNTLLKELSESTFKNALVAGVPDNVQVAHKYGETSLRDDVTGEIITILNDCGIIYKPDSPYILCIMTQGKEYSDLERVIKTISKTVYQSF